MNPRASRGQYLVTYSQADEFSFWESFGKMLNAEFNAGTSVVKVDYWACSKEEPQNDSFHYHCALKLTSCKKWLSVKKIIAEKHCIQVNFSDKHNFYFSAYRNICKSEQEVAHSDNGPPGLLTAVPPKTKKSVAGFRAACATKRKSTEGESSCGVVKKRAGFLFKRNEKTLLELVIKTCQMESAKENLAASKVSRIDTVKTHLTSDCVEGCSGQWL